MSDKADGIEFDVSRVVQAPILLAIPFGILAAASIGMGWQWVWQRFIGSILLISISIACTVGAVRRRQTQLRLGAVKHTKGEVHSLADDNSCLELCRCAPPELVANRVHYASFFVNKSGTRQALFGSQLATQLNALGHLQKQWPINVRAGALLPDTFRKVLNGETDLRIDGNSRALLKSPLRDRQLGSAGIMLAISLLALVVVIFLLTGQLEIHGPVTTLGLSLAALLVSVPLIIAFQLALGRVRVRIENNRLRIERRQGFLGTKSREIPLSEIKGIWLIRTHESGIYELLMLSRGSFLSVPVTQSAWPNWQAVFCQLDSSAC